MTVKNTLPWITSAEVNKVLSTLDEANLSGFSGTLIATQIDDLKISSVDAVKSSTAFLGGKLVRECEKEIAKICGTKYCILMNSATSALMASIVALGLPPNSLIGVPTVSFSATIAAVIAAGHQPVYVDIDRTCTACPDALSNTISTTALQAFIFVQWAGNGSNLNDIMKICHESKIPLIEDASQATLTQSPDGRFNGSVGSCGVFSFNGPKNLSAGEGGCIITDDSDIAFYSRLTRNHGEAALIAPQKVDLNRFKVGFNLRPTEITAALALSQISRREELHDLRAVNFKSLCNTLEGYIEPVKGSESQLPYCGAFFLCSEQKGLKQAVLKKAKNLGIPIFGNYPLEHWEIGQLFGCSIDLQEYPGTEFYLERYLGVFSIAYPNGKEEMYKLSQKIREILDDMPSIITVESREQIFDIGRTL